jgi:hypothetical protein
MNPVTIFLASPGDVAKERKAVDEVVTGLNASIAHAEGVNLIVKKWEKDTYPGYGKDAQAVINDQIGRMEQYTLLVGIMWNRFGTETPRAGSGTAEEFQRAAEVFEKNGRPFIWFYFRDAAAKLDDPAALEQRGRVLEFRKAFDKKGYSKRYKTPAAFREQFRNDLLMWLKANNWFRPAGNTHLPGPTPGPDREAAEAEEAVARYRKAVVDQFHFQEESTPKPRMK